MGRLDFEQFIGKHNLPECRVVNKIVAINSPEIDPSCGDYKPEFVEALFCETHRVYATTPPTPVRPQGSS